MYDLYDFLFKAAAGGVLIFWLALMVGGTILAMVQAWRKRGTK